MQKEKEWRVIFVVYAYLKGGKNDEMTRHLRNFLQTLLKSKVSLINCYYIILNVVNDNPKKTKLHDRTILYKITNNYDNKTKFKQLEVFNTDLLAQKPAELLKVFIRIKTDIDSKAKRSILFTWDHGSVFGIFRRDKKLSFFDMLIGSFFEKNVNSRLAYDHFVRKKIIAPRFQIYRRWWDISIKPTGVPGFSKSDNRFILANFKEDDLPRLTFDILHNEDLSNVIGQGVEGKVDIMVMANCYMQNIHAASAFKNNVNILIAPQGDLEFPCYDYLAIIACIEDRPAITTKDLSGFIIERSKSIFTIDHQEKLSLFATDLSYVDNIEKEISVVTDYLIKQISESDLFKMRIQYILQYCFEFETGLPYSSRDIVNFLQQVKFYKSYNESDLIDFFQRIQVNIDDFIVSMSILANKFIIAKHTGIRFIDYIDDNYSYRRNILPKALSLFFPDNHALETYPEVTYIAFRSDFISHTPWGKFLNALK